MKIFISHITEESALAVILKDWIESTFTGQYNVFVSSDLRDIPAGNKWLNAIEQALDGSKVMLLLCSPKSILRPWINFEAGAAWIKHIPIVPICHSGQKKGNLPVPISVFQALEIDSDKFVQDLLESLARHLDVSRVPRIDQSAMRRELEHAIGSIPKDSQTVHKPETSMASSIDDTALKVLQAVAIHCDHDFNAAELASVFQMTTPKMEYFLDILLDAKLLHRILFVGAPPT